MKQLNVAIMMASLCQSPVPSKMKITQKIISITIPVFLCIALTPSSNAAAESIVMIVNASNNSSSLTKSDLNNIYRGKQSTWSNGGKIKVVNHPIDSDIRKDFFGKVLNESPGQEFIISGSPKPFRTSIRKSDASILRYVGRFEGAIGYVYASTIDDSGKVKIVYTLN